MILESENISSIDPAMHIYTHLPFKSDDALVCVSDQVVRLAVTAGALTMCLGLFAVTLLIGIIDIYMHIIFRVLPLFRKRQYSD